MSDLFQGRSMSEAYQFISGGLEHTFTFNFQPDKVVFNNLTAWTATAGKLPRSVWYRGQTDDAEAFQWQVIDSAAGSSFNFLDTTTNGFTVADTSGGVTALRATIAGITQADPCVVTTTAAHGFQSNQIVRITDLGSDMPTARGMDQLNNNRYRITVIDGTSFSLQNVISGEDIDSTAYTAWVAAGFVTAETHVITQNNPQSGTYTANPYEFAPVVYKLTAGTSVMGTDGDVYLIEVYKWGQLYDLGDIG